MITAGTITAVIGAVTALIVAVTGLITALRAHGRITALAPPAKHAQQPGQQPPADQ